VLEQPAYGANFDGDGGWRIQPGSAEHARAALLALAPNAVLVDDTGDEIEAALREADELWAP
jgi:hypothetical protein